MKLKVIIYSPSSCFIPVWVSFFSWSQRKIFWRMSTSRWLLDPIDFNSREKKFYWSQWGPKTAWLL